MPIIIVVMGKSRLALLPGQEKIMRTLGDNLRLARLRRDLSAAQTAERAGISRTTLHKIELGDSGVAIGAYLTVLYTLNLEQDFAQVARDDDFGRTLQDAKLIPSRRRASRQTAPKSGASDA
jgi:transcriptional regulator with XRE-family HTH domain